ncbi:TPA_asm: L [Phyllostachys alphacytorhabdovirus 1]|nr:TPA_asm: L [Phyllostachys alphacytorhabdovirus 1]
MFSLFSELDSNPKNIYDPLPDYHLQNPLHSVAEMLQKYKMKLKLPMRIKRSLVSLSSVSQALEEGNHIHLPSILQSFVTSDIDGGLMKDALGDVRSRLGLEHQAIPGFDTSRLSESLDHLCKNFPIELWNGMRFAQRILLVLNAISSRREPPAYMEELSEGLYGIRDNNGNMLLVTPSFIGIRRGLSKTIKVYHSDWLRGAADVLTERFLIICGSIVGAYLNPMHYPPRNIVADVIEWGDGVLRLLGNNGFKLLKAFEALVLGVLQTRGRGEFVDPGRFLHNTLLDLWEESVTFGRLGQTLVNMLEKVESPHHLTQIYGMHRIWGHPLTDAAKGMEKMIIIGQKDIVRSERTPKVMSGHFKKIFCKAYKMRTGEYPGIQMDEGALSQMLINNADWKSCDRDDLAQDWENLHFTKTFNIPESFNLSMIVADKSVSPTRSELKNNVIKRGTVMNQELRRGVLRWINHDTIDPREFLASVNNGDFPDDHKIIGLRSKERELNPTPRMFALMSHLMRVYVVITESMLSEHILPYFPQITMTDTQLDLIKKMYTTVRNQSMKTRVSRKLLDTRTVCMSLDFEKWNGHMRKESTYGVFQALGELFGMPNLYNVTYDLFRESYFYLADGSYIPSMNSDGDFTPDPPYSFTGHRGGQEGLRQKGWTLFTVSCLDYICSRHNCTYKIMGMGDNQVLQITLYTSLVDAGGSATEEGLRRMKRTLNNLFENLLETFSELGLPLKPLETWISEDLFVYGKYPIWQGVPLSMDLKKVMRMFPFSNQDIMTVENILNTVAGNAQAAVQSAPSIGVSYILGVFMLSISCADLLIYHPLSARGLLTSLKDTTTWTLKLTKGKRSLRYDIGSSVISTPSLRRMMYSVPRILGGYVSFHLTNLLMRGFPDALSMDLSVMYKWVSSDSDDNIIEYLRRWVSPIFMPERSLKLLVEDVGSVNLLAPVTPTAGLRQVVEKFLKDGRVIKNTEFRDLMMTRDDDIEDIIVEHLCSEENLHIRLLHDIMEATIFGYIKSITSKVTKSSTILGLAVSKAANDPLMTVIKDEENYFRFFLWRNNISSDYKISDCPTTQAKRMRRDGWLKNLIGVTVAHPIAYMAKTSCFDQNMSCDCEDGYMSLYLPDEKIPAKVWDLEIGGCPPYLGSMTREKVTITTGTKIYSGEPLIKRPVNLMRVINWFVPGDSETAKVITACVSAVSDINPNLFKGVTEGSSGSEIHRFKDTSLKHGALTSSNYLYSTRYHISSDSFTRYAKGSQNYDVLFQAIYCMIIEGTHQYIVKQNTEGEAIRKVIHYKQCCYECLNPLDETFYDLRPSRLPLIVPANKLNKYLYVKSEDVSVTAVNSQTVMWQANRLTETRYHDLGDDEKLGWLVDSMADSVFADLYNSSSEETFMTTALLDVKEHNRLFYLTVPPEKLFLQVLHRIRLAAEWRCMAQSDWKVPTVRSIKRTAEAMISETPESRWAGMVGFFSWEESMRLYYFAPEIMEPNTIPVTTASACKAIKESFLGLLYYNRWENSRNTSLVVDDLKDSGITLKLVVYDWLKQNTTCKECWRTVGTTPVGIFSRKRPETFVCSAGHYALSKSKRPIITYSMVTMDRLRKDCPGPKVTRAPHISPLWEPLQITSVSLLINCRDIISKPIPYTESSLDEDLKIIPIVGADLFKLASLPTNAAYKYTEIFSYLIRELNREKIAFICGNGLGQTSDVLLRLWQGKVIVSTLLDTGSAIPQVYPHSNIGKESFQNKNIDSQSMIPRMNDILHDDWEGDWEGIMIDEDVGLIISDVEINREENQYDRDEVIQKMLGLYPWRLMILKDYIYSRRELKRRLSIILAWSKDVRLITCGTRQRVVPEVWWIIRNRNQTESIRGSYQDSTISDLWENIKWEFQGDCSDVIEVIEDINKRLITNKVLAQMYIKARSWALIPIVGCALPTDGSYTQLLGYLQRGKRPKIVHWNKEATGRNLYRSDHDKLRTVLFGLAVGMLSSYEAREEMLEASSRWHLDWEISKTGSWVPFLILTDVEDIPVHVYDMIPILSTIMMKERLLFSDCKTTIRFRHSKKRKYLCFPITRTSALRHT